MGRNRRALRRQPNRSSLGGVRHRKRSWRMNARMRLLLIFALSLGSARESPAAGTVLVGSVSAAITNPAPARGDAFGSCISAIGGDKVIIGAYLDDAGAVDAGAAYLFSTSGALLTTFTNPAPALRDYFGSRLAVLGTDKVVIGAYEAGLAATGAAYLFSTNGTLLTAFTNPVPWAGDYFGSAVGALGSDRVLVGSFSSDGGATTPGAAFLFDTNGALLTTFTNPAPDLADNFGHPLVALGTDKVLIGAPQDDAGAFDAGVAYLFTDRGKLLTTFTNPAPGTSDYFGASIAVVGGALVVIGAYGQDAGATEAGAAYLFHTNGTLVTTFSSPSPGVYDHFGAGVAGVGSDKVLISAPGDERLGGVEGTVYLFNTKGVLLAAFTAPPCESRGTFGAAFAVLGSNAFAIGSHQDDTGAEDAGAVYLFQLETIRVPNLNVTPVDAFNVRLSWPRAAAAFRLEETEASLEPAATQWREITSLYESNSTNSSVIVPSSIGTRFYRLRYP